MRRTEKPSNYNTLYNDSIIDYIIRDIEQLKSETTAETLQRINRAKLKKIAAELNNIIKTIEE